MHKAINQGGEMAAAPLAFAACIYKKRISE